MADAVYPSFLDSLWNGQVNIGTDVYKVSILSSAYTYSSTHTKFSDLSGVLGSASLANVSTSNGVFDADDTQVPISAGTPHSVVLYQYNAGTPGNSRLMAYFDQGSNFDASASGTITVIWPNTANVKILPLWRP